MKYQILDQETINKVSAEAKNSTRLRKNFNFHKLTDHVQRMLNAIEPDSYVCPHRHLEPPKVEFFILLRGRLAVIIFNDNGTIDRTIFLDEKTIGIDIKPGTWHTIISLEPGTVVLEAKDGPYVAATDKDFAPWAPREGTPGVKKYFAELKGKI
jgi:cupin fold WbuC family metalloprotein